MAKHTPGPWTDEEFITILEVARIGLADADIFDWMADMLDINDGDMVALRDKLDTVMNDCIAEVAQAEATIAKATSQEVSDDS